MLRRRPRGGVGRERTLEQPELRVGERGGGQPDAADDRRVVDVGREERRTVEELVEHECQVDASTATHMAARPLPRTIASATSGGQYRFECATWSARSPARCADPKSTSFHSPILPKRMKCSGFTSQCTQPAACTAATTCSTRFPIAASIIAQSAAPLSSPSPSSAPPAAKRVSPPPPPPPPPKSTACASASAPPAWAAAAPSASRLPPCEARRRRRCPSEARSGRRRMRHLHHEHLAVEVGERSVQLGREGGADGCERRLARRRLGADELEEDGARSLVVVRLTRGSAHERVGHAGGSA